MVLSSAAAVGGELANHKKIGKKATEGSRDSMVNENTRAGRFLRGLRFDSRVWLLGRTFGSGPGERYAAEVAGVDGGEIAKQGGQQGS